MQTLTVHHTAGSNTLTQDYAATVRAIYSYHVQTNGWSDIGYQYLVDGAGKVYEGRASGHVSTSCLSAGGDGRDFAHETGTDEMVTGAHVAGFNSGNLGVALMGCYESSTECAGGTTPPAAAVDSLETLLASLSTRHGLDPRGTVRYVNPVNGVVKDVATISGHRDWEATACPGGNLYAGLPAIRAEVAARTTGAAPTPVPSAPEQPTGFTATASGSTVSLAWSPPATDGGAPTSRYELFRGATTAPTWTGTATAATDRPGPGTWTYAIRACNTAGCGPTATAGPVTTTPPASITSGSCSRATCTFSGSGTGTLRWTFGNGTSRQGTPVSTTYAAKGTYTVTLTDSQAPATKATRRATCSLVKRAVTCTT